MIFYVGNLYTEVEGIGDSARRELSEYLTVKSPNLFWIRRNPKLSRWDGNITYLNSKNQFPSGFVPYVFNKFKDAKWVDERDVIPAIKDYNIRVHDLRPNQIKVCDLVLSNKLNGWYWYRGILDCATNFGKNSVIAALHNSLQGQSILTVHNKNIFKGAYTFLSKACRGSVGRIGDGHEEWGDLTLIMYKTLLNRLEDHRDHINQVNTLFVDECHRASSKEYNKLLKNIPAPNRLFLSGTPLAMEDIIKRLAIVSQSGQVIAKVTNQDLIKKSYSQRPTIHMYPVDDVLGFNYKEERDKLYRSVDRIKIIIDAAKEFKQILISVKIKEHGELLEFFLKKRGQNVKFIHANHPERFSAVKDFDNFKLDILISTMILKEGVNIINIRCLILAHGEKSEITLKQFIGRSLRHDQINADVTVIDFIDKGSILFKNSMLRKNIYKKEGFKVVVHEKKSKVKRLK